MDELKNDLRVVKCLNYYHNLFSITKFIFHFSWPMATSTGRDLRLENRSKIKNIKFNKRVFA